MIFSYIVKEYEADENSKMKMNKEIKGWILYRDIHNIT